MNRIVALLFFATLGISSALAQTAANVGIMVPNTPPAAGGGSPTGAAGGTLSGTYPNPTLATAQPSPHTWAATQTFTVAPVFTDQPGSRTALGLGTSSTVNTGTSGAAVPLLNGANTWSAANGFTTLTGTSLALGGATIGTDALSVTGTATFTGAVATSSTVTAGSNFVMPNGGIVTWGTRARISTALTGNILIANGNATDMGLLQFGGTSASFPAWKKSTTTLQARLADDSAFTAVQGKLTTDTAFAAGATTATGYVTLYDSTGTAYKVNACLASGC